MSTPDVLLPRAATPRAERDPRSSGRAVAIARRVRPELVALLLVAAVLDLWALNTNGWANTYYSAAIRSMSTSWHDFLYGSFDSAGLQTVDKPPLALWVQALSVRAFGFSSWAILVPQALMGVATVGLAYDLVQRRFGRAAGFAGGLVLALTPMTVAISRHNNPDALVVLCSVGALWAIVRGLQDGRTRWMVLAGVCVGLGFEAKMGTALLVVPALGAAWLWVAPRGRLAALRSSVAGLVAMVVVGGAWPLLIALTPASDRPWISGTTDNSIWSLITNYNGLGRLDGQSGGPGGGAGGAGGVFGGATGPLRLLHESLGGQAGWMLGGALVAGLGLLAITRLRREDPRTGWAIAAFGCFATCAVAFSTAKGIFHPYYVSALAPYTAVLVGTGVGIALQRGRAARIVGALAIVGAMVSELLVIRFDATDLSWLKAVILVAGALAAAAVATLGSGRVRRVALAVAATALLAGPAIWSVQTLGHATSSTFPAGGPASASMSMGGGAPGGGGTRPSAPSGGVIAARGSAGGGIGGDQDLTSVIEYIDANGGGTLAVEGQNGASQSILSSDAKVAGIGGFSGRESSVTTSWLADAVASGRLRWVLTGGSSGGLPNDTRAGSTAAMTAVTKACTIVKTTSSSSSALYDCSGKASALRALAS